MSEGPGQQTTALQDPDDRSVVPAVRGELLQRSGRPRLPRWETARRLARAAVVSTADQLRAVAPGQPVTLRGTVRATTVILGQVSVEPAVLATYDQDWERYALGVRFDLVLPDGTSVPVEPTTVDVLRGPRSKNRQDPMPPLPFPTPWTRFKPLVFAGAVFLATSTALGTGLDATFWIGSTVGLLLGGLASRGVPRHLIERAIRPGQKIVISGVLDLEPGSEGEVLVPGRGVAMRPVLRAAPGRPLLVAAVR